MAETIEEILAAGLQGHCTTCNWTAHQSHQIEGRGFDFYVAAMKKAVADGKVHEKATMTTFAPSRRTETHMTGVRSGTRPA